MVFKRVFDDITTKNKIKYSAWNKKGRINMFIKSEKPTNLVNIDLKNGGTITIELYPETAPVTVENFKQLVADGFYNGIIFHRVISGFMIQGGDPTGTGMGGSKSTIKGEFSANGVKNELSHKRGVVSMARTNIPDSAYSQFFICHADSTFLDGQYAAFGKVIEGIENVDKIADVKTDFRDKPYEDQVMEKVYFVSNE